MDWGLGHTSRCVPIISYLQRLGHKITFAGNDWQRNFIEETFPGIDTIHIDGYNIEYNSDENLLFSILKQTPGILKTIKREHEWLAEQVKDGRFDAVISDNRYGLYSSKIPSVIITHQLEVQTGQGQIANNLFKRQHYKMLGRFSEIWVPDVSGHPNLSGKLGHPEKLPANTHYIGCLSQLETAKGELQEDGSLLALLSGVEPQRSILSKQLWQNVCAYNRKVVFVEGNADASGPDVIPSHITYLKQITRKDLLPIMQQASLVIARSGYSTIMDLALLNKKAILIPTPGQTEQEYLGTHLHKQGVFYCTPQKGFKLEKSLKEIGVFPFSQLQMENSYSQFQSVIDPWLSSM
jgi:hypothetical protein